jgi:hypothetical protein
MKTSNILHPFNHKEGLKYRSASHFTLLSNKRKQDIFTIKIMKAARYVIIYHHQLLERFRKEYKKIVFA